MKIKYLILPVWLLLLPLMERIKSNYGEIKNKIRDTSHFIITLEIRRQTKISFDARMKNQKKSLASKTEMNHAVDLGDTKDIKK